MARCAAVDVVGAPQHLTLHRAPTRNPVAATPTLTYTAASNTLCPTTGMRPAHPRGHHIKP
eukprot:7254348-Alexandrium_andersonii.AAC.1